MLIKVNFLEQEVAHCLKTIRFYLNSYGEDNIFLLNKDLVLRIYNALHEALLDLADLVVWLEARKNGLNVAGKSLLKPKVNFYDSLKTDLEVPKEIRLILQKITNMRAQKFVTADLQVKNKKSKIICSYKNKLRKF